MFTLESSGGQPPYLSSKKRWDNQIVMIGQSTTLKCPVEGNGRQPVYYRWFKVGMMVLLVGVYLCHPREQRSFLMPSLVTDYQVLRTEG